MTSPPPPPPPPPPPSSPDHRAEVVELYKLATEMADRASARRGIANGFFLSLQTALITLMGFGVPKVSDAPWWMPLSMTLAGITLSSAWWVQLRSYRDLSAAKFKVILRTEEMLPVRFFSEEWDALRADQGNRKFGRYAELGTSERIIPFVFMGIHSLLFVGYLSTW